MTNSIAIFITSEIHFLLYDGDVYTDSLGNYAYWQRYLSVFSSVHVLARVRKVTTLPAGAVQANGALVDFTALPDFVGPVAGAAKIPQLLALTRQIAKEDTAFILRVPGIVSSMLSWWLRRRRWPYGVRVVGDPAQSLSPEALQKWWTYLTRPIFVGEMKRQCRSASAAAYVTRWTLQQHYPTEAEFSTDFSDVNLPDRLFSAPVSIEERLADHVGSVEDRCWRLVFVGSLAQRYKGLHVLLQALRICTDEGLAVSLHVLGDGIHRAEYQQMTADLSLDDHVRFFGHVNSGQVWQHLQDSDLFVMPSLTEGLPRAMLEAMACGVPCVGSSVGGIPELLDAQHTVPPGDPVALAAKLRQVLGDDQRMLAMAQRNRRIAQDYRADTLRKKSLEFWQCVRDVTVAHMQRHAADRRAYPAIE